MGLVLVRREPLTTTPSLPSPHYQYYSSYGYGDYRGRSSILVVSPAISAAIGGGIFLFILIVVCALCCKKVCHNRHHEEGWQGVPHGGDASSRRAGAEAMEMAGTGTGDSTNYSTPKHPHPMAQKAFSASLGVHSCESCNNAIVGIGYRCKSGCDYDLCATCMPTQTAMAIPVPAIAARV